LKVALVVPNNRIQLNSDCSPPLGLAYIAGYVKQNLPDIDVQILDGGCAKDIAKELLLGKFDVVGITATTPQAPDAYALADLIKHCRPDITVVLGGPHISVLPYEALEHADYVVVGEGETAFTQILKDMPGKGIIQGQPIEDLDSLPMPTYDLLNIEFYLSRTFIEQVLPPPILGLVTSRGCPYRCRFCYNNNRTARVRYLSAKRVAKELTFLHNKYCVSNFFFQDDEFLINRKRLEELAEIFKSEGINRWIRWGCQARVTSLNKEVLALVESMGCVLIVPGFESYNPRILKYLKKDSVKTTDIDKAVKLFRNTKIMLGGNFIFGSPTETLAEMQQTFQFYLDHPEITFMIPNCLTPYPGTEVWEDCVKFGLLPEKLDYSLLLPTDEMQNVMNFSTLQQKTYVSYLKDIRRVRRVVQNIRFGIGFFSMARRKVWWWMWLKHPKIMIKLLKQTKNRNPFVNHQNRDRVKTRLGFRKLPVL